MTKPKANPDARIIKPTTLRIDKPGVYDGIAAEDYHGDFCPEPSLSASIVTKMITRSPRHAWQAHSRLNPNLVREHAEHLDKGEGAHALLLEGVDRFHVIGADSYRTDQAKAERAWAWENGKLPVLAHKMPEIKAMVGAAKAQIAADELLRYAFHAGKPEVTLVWFDEEFRVWCRCRLDWLPSQGSLYPDLKFSGMSAHPDDVERRMYSDPHYLHIRARWYERGIAAVLGVPQPQYGIVSIEDSAPHALSLVGVNPKATEWADAEIRHAMRQWRWCLDNNRWGGYRRGINWSETPRWLDIWAERQAARREFDGQSNAELFERALEWQSTGASKSLAAPANDAKPTEAA